MDGGIWHCVWSPDSYLTGNADLDRQGFPTAADNAVGKGMGSVSYTHLIDTEAFMGAEAFKKTCGDILRDLRGSEKAPGQERIYTAGEKEYLSLIHI